MYPASFTRHLPSWLKPLESTPRGRIAELDALRAAAAINLILFHFSHVYAVKFGYHQPLGFEWPFGAYGVEMFFILSGFLNATSLIKGGSVNRYLGARLIRIVPIFWLAILANLWIVELPPHVGGDYPIGIWLANMTLIPKLFGYDCVDPVMWTLQVEIMFYGIIAILFSRGLLSGRLAYWTWGTLAAIAMLICPWLDSPAAAAAPGFVRGLAHILRSLLILDFIPLMAIGFFLFRIKFVPTASKLASITALTACAAVFHSIDHGKHNPVATMLIIALVTTSAYGKIPFLRLRPILFIASISYPLYLCHNNLGCAVIRHFENAGVPSLLAMVIAIMFSFSLATLVSTRIEQPMSRWLSTRLGVGKRASATTAEPIAVPAS